VPADAGAEAGGETEATAAAAPSGDGETQS
jgi:hypothetical protein